MSSERMEVKRHELLSDMAAHGTTILMDHGIPEDVAQQAALAIADHMAMHWGGQSFTFPKDYLFKMSGRDLLIYKEFTGANYDTLARKFDMTERGMRKLIDRVHKRELNKRQNRLFD
jgi:Mor family transcriptional regulator